MPEFQSIAGLQLGPEWFVEVHQPDALLLRQKDPRATRRVIGAGLVSLATAAGALFLIVETPERMGLIAWPVALMLLVVCVLSFTATLRHARRRSRGVFLHFTREHVEGWPVSLSVSPRRAPTNEVRSLTVHEFKHDELTLVMFEPVLADGTKLVGPELAIAPGAPHSLARVRAAAAQFLPALVG